MNKLMVIGLVPSIWLVQVMESPRHAAIREVAARAFNAIFSDDEKSSQKRPRVFSFPADDVDLLQRLARLYVAFSCANHLGLNTRPLETMMAYWYEHMVIKSRCSGHGQLAYVRMPFSHWCLDVTTCFCTHRIHGGDQCDIPALIIGNQMVARSRKINLSKSAEAMKYLYGKKLD